MINQVEFEGYLTRAWEYREQRYMRLANHRPGENSKTQTDYVTVQIDSSLDFDPCRLKVGSLLRAASEETQFGQTKNVLPTQASGPDAQVWLNADYLTRILKASNG